MEQNEKVHIFKTVICKKNLFHRNKGCNRKLIFCSPDFGKMIYWGMGREINGNSQKKDYL